MARTRRHQHDHAQLQSRVIGDGESVRGAGLDSLASGVYSNLFFVTQLLSPVIDEPAPFQQ